MLAIIDETGKIMHYTAPEGKRLSDVFLNGNDMENYDNSKEGVYSPWKVGIQFMDCLTSLFCLMWFLRKQTLSNNIFGLT